MADEKMLTMSEAATELGIGMASLYRYVKKYQLKTFRKIGDKRGYLRAADIEQLKGFLPKGEQPGNEQQAS